MSRLFPRPAIWTVCGSLFWLTFACSSEEAGTGPGGATSTTGTDGSGPTSGSGIPSGTTEPSSTMNGTTTNDPTTSGPSTSDIGVSPTTDTVSPTTDTATSGPAPNDTRTTEEGTEPGDSTDDGTNSSDNTSGTGADDNTSGIGTGGSTSGTEADDETSGSEDDGDTGTDTETTDETTSTGGPSTGGNCTPNPSGDFVAEGEVVLDQKTCLTWMKANVTGHSYTAADAYCADLTLAGYDDWRLPTAGEATTIFHCQGTYPPVYDIFTVMGDGIWTTTESGTIVDEPKVCGAGQNSGQFYDFGKVGAQNTRCVRGPVTVADRADCKTNYYVCQ